MKRTPFFLLSLPLLLSACGPAQPDLGAGFRFSTYGIPMALGPEYWASVGEQMAGKFEGATPQGIWILGNIYGEGTYLNFPCETQDPYVLCGYADMNEAYLDLFDEQGVQVWLQVEAGYADMLGLIDLVLERYGHHPSVLGFGVDVEWYQSPEGPMGVPISDELAESWVKAVRKHNPDYRLFLKHWEIEWMPPTYREGILFVNDHQQFESFAAMLANFTAWGEKFAPAPVAYQFGYLSDKVWWGEMSDPPQEMGQAFLDAIPNTAALFWVDFTVLDVFPVEDE